jgi:hypothetical protein
MKKSQHQPADKARKPEALDPLNVNTRLYKQLGLLLDQLERKDDAEDGPRVTLKERIAALIAVGRIQTIFMGLRRESANEPAAGSTVRKYATAFQQNDAGRRKAAAGSTGNPEPVDWFEQSTDDADEPDDAA